jgi:PleD family two-component response regulator
VKILIADDDLVSRRLLERTLQRSGYEVITAEDGRQAACELSKEGGPRLALIDWMMPELDGPGVCREVRSNHDGLYIYILLLTSKQSSEDVVKGLEAGADDYLTKPCHPAELKARLHTGRRILQSTRLLDSVRAHDAVGRYGGEEFLIVLSRCNREHLKSRAEQIRLTIGDVPFPTPEGVISVSLSLGAITIENWDKSMSIELFLKQVDAALYQAKASGRNRVIFAEPCVVV